MREKTRRSKLPAFGRVAGVLAIGAALVSSADGAPSLASFNLVNHIAALPNPGDNPTNFSGVAYNYDTGRLFIVDNGNESVYEYTTAGVPVRKITGTGFDDTEGIAYLGSNKFAIIEEGIKSISIVTIGPATTTISKAGATVINPNIAGTFGNSGFEGVAYNAINNTFYALKEKITTAGGTVAKGVYQVANMPGVATTIQLGAVTATLNPLATDLSDVFFNSSTGGHMYVLSHEGTRVMEVGLDGTLYGNRALIGAQLEGITFSLDMLNMYVIGEQRDFYHYRVKSDGSRFTHPVLVPEPGSMVSLGVACGVMLAHRHRRASKLAAKRGARRENLGARTLPTDESRVRLRRLPLP